MVVDLAQGICRIPSPLGGEKPLAVYVARRLRELEFEVELQDVVQDRPNVVAIRRGNPVYKSFMFNGHLDIPEPFGEWSHDPYDPWIADDLLFGGGLQDMKGGVAALIAGAAEASSADPATSGDVVVTVVMHHDTTGVGTQVFSRAECVAHRRRNLRRTNRPQGAAVPWRRLGLGDNHGWRAAPSEPAGRGRQRHYRDDGRFCGGSPRNRSHSSQIRAIRICRGRWSG